MKNKPIKAMLALLFTTLILCSCASNEALPANNETDSPNIATEATKSTSATTEKTTQATTTVKTTTTSKTTTIATIATDTAIKTTPKTTTAPTIRQKSIDDVRRKLGYSDEKALENMLERYSKGIATSNILLGIAVESDCDPLDKGRMSSDMDVFYSFKVTDNLTGNPLSEYIKVKSQYGDIFEIGKEYLIAPLHNDNVLWNTHHVVPVGVISRDLLSDSDLDKIRQAGKNKQNNDKKTVIEKASLESDFIKSVDLAVIITITGKERNANNIYDVHYKLVEVLSGKKHAHILNGEEMLRLNTDVKVGEKYLIMFEVFEDSWVLPAAREGAVVSEKSADYEKYREAFKG